MSEADMIYKVIALYLLSKANYPLSNKQVTEFFIEGKYTDYFHIQQTISDLAEKGMIGVEQGANETFYAISEEGKKTLALFQERLTGEIRSEVTAFFEKNGVFMKRENGLFSEYYKDPLGGVYVHLRYAEETKDVMDMTFHVASEAVAESICTNWKQRYEDVYASLMEDLL